MTINADTRGIMAKNFKPRRKKTKSRKCKGMVTKATMILPHLYS